MDVTPLRVKKLETLFAQQSVQPRAAKVSRLAHDGSQPMAPSLSSGALCVCVCVCDRGRKKEKGRETEKAREIWVAVWPGLNTEQGAHYKSTDCSFSGPGARTRIFLDRIKECAGIVENNRNGEFCEELSVDLIRRGAASFMSPDPLLKSGFERVSKSENIWERATSVAFRMGSWQ